MEDRIRMVGVRRCFVHTRVGPTWVSPGPPSPLSIPPRPYLPDSPASGTARVPAPPWKRRGIRRVRKRPRCRVCASASISLLSILATIDDPSNKICMSYFILTTIHLSSIAPAALLVDKNEPSCRGDRQSWAILADAAGLPYNALQAELVDEVRRWPLRCRSFF
jgi:hypothetical protein